MRKFFLTFALNLFVLGWVCWRGVQDMLFQISVGLEPASAYPWDAWLVFFISVYLLGVFVVQMVRARKKPLQPRSQASLDADMAAFLRILVATKDGADVALMKPAARRLLDAHDAA